MEAVSEFNLFGGFSETDLLLYGYQKGEDGKWHPPSLKCDYCHKDAIGYCGKCKKIYYCSKKCQKRQWNYHKDDCNP